jgi:hypothetical protein
MTGSSRPFPEPGGRYEAVSLKPQVWQVSYASACFGRENHINLECEQGFPEPRPEAMGRQSTDVVDPENEVGH